MTTDVAPRATDARARHLVAARLLRGRDRPTVPTDGVPIADELGGKDRR